MNPAIARILNDATDVTVPMRTNCDPVALI